ncbi:interferon-inducible GTPase 1-like [Mya arenaria]|uniref:interferon-inducible GTPase 1-like n=1 Tax=Mya arenaria TaxID=6604 RepID=UPI0022E16732|nr:interferon-inducible GTPase 1-like [Mya arenaria]
MGFAASKQVTEECEQNEDLQHEKDVKKFQDAFESGGYSDLHKIVSDNLDEWKKIELNIAVTGKSGSGKSSFINAFMNKKPGDEGAAEVGGFEETTMKIKKYKHEKYNMCLWDLPGIGTARFPRDEYLRKTSFTQFDFFLIVTATRLSENDVYLAKEVHEKMERKRFFLLRTKLDDVSKEKKRSEEELEKIRFL